MAEESASAPDAELRAEKARLRKRILALRTALSPEMRGQASAAIARHVRSHPEYRRAAGVHCFLSLPGEVDTAAILAACGEDGKRIYVPYVDRASGRLEAAPWKHGDSLTRGALGVMEPVPEARVPVAPGEIGLVLAPGLAFDRRAHRLGYGKGYYDGFLSRLKAGSTPPAVIAVAFSAQIVDEVPVGPGDVPMDGLITEEGFFPAP